VQNAVDQRLTIGAVLTILQNEFPDADVTISKIRFLEAEGLVDPGRTPTGYRKFSPTDVDRLRYTLRMQRDHFLPLKVIREHLDKIDRGFEPPTVAENAPRVVVDDQSEDAIPAPLFEPATSTVTMSVTDLAEQVGMSVSEIVELRQMKMISPLPGSDEFGVDALEVARGISVLTQFGIEARHLRPVMNAADRQVQMISNLLGPKLAGSIDSEADEVRQEAQHLARDLLRLQSTVMRSALAQEFGHSNTAGR